MDNKITNILLATLVILSCTMLIFTLNYVSSFDATMHTTISAFNA